MVFIRWSAVAFVVLGCDVEPDAARGRPSVHRVESHDGDAVSVYHDDAHCVTCWVVPNGQGGQSISCVQDLGVCHMGR